MRKRLPVWVLMTFGLSTLVLGLSGGWTDPWVWAYCVTWSTILTYGFLGIDEDLARERFDPPSRGADGVALGFIRLLGLVHLVVGALDGSRWELAGPVPHPVRAVALAGMAVAMVLVFRSMHENRYFSSVIRVQDDRGHRVIDTGPYSVVRHPGYAGMLVALPFGGLALGSWISFGIALAFSALVVRRVVVEDAFLLRNLQGYTDYTRRVRHRLIPGTW